jgi:site-specific recombinase XerD
VRRFPHQHAVNEERPPERVPVTRKVAGSNPVSPATRAKALPEEEITQTPATGPRTLVSVYALHVTARVETWGVAHPYPLSPMFPAPAPRPSTRQPSPRPPTDAQAVTPAETPPAVLRFQTLEDLDARFTAFLEHAAYVLGHSKDSVRGYKGTYGNFRRYLAARAAVPLPARLCDIEGWIAWNRKREGQKPLSSVTLNTYYRQLRPFFNDLEYRDGIQNPFHSVPPPRLPKGRLPKAKSYADCQQILATAEHHEWPSAFDRWRAMAVFALFLYAGLRKGEILRLKFGHVDLREGTLFIENSKGEKDRVVTIAPELRAILARYITERRVRFAIPESDAARRAAVVGPAFLTSTTTRQGISEMTLRRIVRIVRRASGVEFSMHSLRHSFITTLLNNGTPIHVAQHLAGHAKITTTAGYLALTNADLHREIQKLTFRRRQR